MQPILILVSDVHLSHVPPAARAGEPSWYEAMARPLSEIRQLAIKHDASIVYAGDIFDRWNSPPELINFAYDNLPPGYAVYGQHDVPNHAEEEFDRGAYATLVRMGRLVDMRPDMPYRLDCGYVLHGFPWRAVITPPVRLDNSKHIAVVHRYIASVGHAHVGASQDCYTTSYNEVLQGYKVAHFGDNHSGFIAASGDCLVANCGTMMRRRTDEADYRPFVGLLMDNGTIKMHFLDISKDVHDAKQQAELSEASASIRDYAADLASLPQDALDFRATVDEVLTQTSATDGCRRRVMEAIG